MESKTKTYWTTFYKEGIVGSDEDLERMLHEVINAHDVLLQMDNGGMFLLVRSHLAQTYEALRNIAHFRKLPVPQFQNHGEVQLTQ